MFKKASLFTCFIFAVISAMTQVRVTRLLTDNLVNPIAVSTTQPRFSWQLESDRRAVLQTAYEILVTENNKPVWKSGKVISDQSVMVSYGGNTLQSRRGYQWKVRVWDNLGKPSAWSTAASFEMAILQPSEWSAKWIIPGYIEDSVFRPSPMFRKTFQAGKKIRSARAYITSHGIYQAELNGSRIGEDYFTPGWTSYKKRLQYQVYDVTSLLRQGKNAIGVTLGSGWYRGTIGFTNSSNFYGKEIALLLELRIQYTDGTEELIKSDESWKSSTGKIRYSEIYNGEIIDARLEKSGWSEPEYNDGAWSAVQVRDYTKDVLIPTSNEPIRKKERFKPVRIFTTPAGEQVIDFGQNLVGWVELKVKGKEGDTITISHAEVLDKKGNFYTVNLRSAKAQDHYVLKGKEEEFFEPNFTWHGFRYIRLEGYPGEVKAENFTAVAMYSDMPVTGQFESSHQLINQLQKNIVWGQKGNFLDVPTDCPQRDERLGWTGDIQAFSRTAAFNMNVHNFLGKWLKDLEADQVNGDVPFVVPNVLGSTISSAGWADAATIVPWNMYLAYGDKKILSDQYSSMKNYVESIRRKAVNNLWNTGFHFGDWLFYRPDDDNDGRAAVTDKYLIAQCFYANSTQLLIHAANVLGKSDDVQQYTALLEKIKEAFVKEYLSANGRLVSGTQTAYVLALNFDMLPESLRASAAQRLADNVKNYGNHLTTGFLGTPYLCHVLTRFGNNDLALQLLLQDTYPSWLYPVKKGATTIWERWDGIKPDSTFQTPSMNSYNHYAYGAIGDWMYRVLVGLNTDESHPGYKHSIIKPFPGRGFTHAKASIDTYYGKLSNSWQSDGNSFSMEVVIPANTTATVYLPAADLSAVKEGGMSLDQVSGIRTVPADSGYTGLLLGSGSYRFTVVKPAGVSLK